jgi:aryl-alcohol dehydrogenase-like predicted oxidoreductase
VLAAVARSRHRTGVPVLFGMLLHRPAWLNRMNHGLRQGLEQARAEGLVRFFGVSVYTAEEAEAALSTEGLDLVQLPANAWDSRMARADILDACREKGKLCFIRSIYLQGLLSLPPEEIERRLPRAAAAAYRFSELAADLGIAPLRLAARYALSLGWPLVVGAETVDQVRENCDLVGLPPLATTEVQRIEAAMTPLVDESILDPGRWPSPA